MSETIKLKFVRPVKVRDAIYKGREIKISEINRNGGEFSDRRDYGKHKGLDFLSKKVEVFASAKGVVVYSGFVENKDKTANYGNTVIIEHTSEAGEYDKYIYTLYAHLDKRSVSQDNKVEQGDNIGTSGNTGTWQYYHHKNNNNEYPKVKTAAYKKCEATEELKAKERGETIEEDKVYERCKGITKLRTTKGYHLHFEVIVSSKKITWDWKTEVPNELRINPETALAEGVEVKYQEPERQVTDADRKKFGERLRIKEKRNARGRLVSHEVWVKNEHVGRLDNCTKEIKLSIPMSKFFALVDGPKPMKRHGEAEFDVKLNSSKIFQYQFILKRGQNLWTSSEYYR